MSPQFRNILAPAAARLREQLSRDGIRSRTRAITPSRDRFGRTPAPPGRRDIGKLVADVNDLVNRRFPDLAFLDPGGELTVSPRVSSVTALRVVVPGKNFLRLASVLIDAGGLTDPVNETTREMSSVWPGYEKKLKSGLLFDPDNRMTSVHSKEEYRPWLQMRFQQPVDLRGVRLRNRPDHVLRSRPDMPARVANGIQIWCQTEDGRWTSLYDGLQREREMVHACADIYGPVSEQGTTETGSGTTTTSSLTAGADLVRILTALHRREYQPALVRDLARVDVAADGKRQFREAVNAQILHDRQLEWIIHGVRRSFRFWSEREKQGYVDHAMQVVDDLTELTPNVCFGFGSVLAAVRDHDLIPHDDDLDLIVGFEPEQASTVAQAFTLIEQFLTHKGYIVAGEHHAHRRVSQPGVKKVDVFAGIFEDDRIGWYPGHRRALSRHSVFPGKAIPFLGRDYLVPQDPEGYLEQIYGPNWKTPDKHFDHGTAARKEYADIEG